MDTLALTEDMKGFEAQESANIVTLQDFNWLLYRRGVISEDKYLTMNSLIGQLCIIGDEKAE